MSREIAKMSGKSRLGNDEKMRRSWSLAWQPDAVSAYICVAVPCVGRRARTAR